MICPDFITIYCFHVLKYHNTPEICTIIMLIKIKIGTQMKEEKRTRAPNEAGKE